MTTIETGLHKPIDGLTIIADYNCDLHFPSNGVFHIQVNWSGGAGSYDGTCELMNSNDGVSYNSYGGGGLIFNIDSASGSHSIEDVYIAAGLNRLVFTMNNITSLILNVFVTFKKT